MKILLVEDSATLRYAMSRSITNAGHTPIIAERGEQAAQIVETSLIDMIIMDVEMPGLNGFETTRLIREMLKDHWIPIIFVTGKSEEKDLRQGIDAGGDDYLIKPVSEAILLAKISAMERIIQMRDQLNELNKELTILSECDSLTKLLNRRTFDERADDQWRVASRNREPISLLLMDIDHFKNYNDTYGHLAGDDCIRRVAQAIQTSVNRPGDILARYGGEEFIALLPNTPESGAQHVSELIQETISNLNIAHSSSSTHSYVTLSIGGAVINSTSGTKLREHIHAADKALYGSKKNGRNRITISPFVPKTSIVISAEATSPLIEPIDESLGTRCQIIPRNTRESALEAAISKRPDAIVIETVRASDSASLVSALRTNPATNHIPIILIYSDQTNDFADVSTLPVSVALDLTCTDSVRLVETISRFIGNS